MLAKKPFPDSKALDESKFKLIPLKVEPEFETMLFFKDAKADLKLLLSMMLDFERLKAKLTIMLIWLFDNTSFNL